MSEGRRYSRDDIRAIALYQRGIIACIAIYLLAVPVRLAVPPEFRIILAVVALPLGITATAFVLLLSTKLYSTGVGILLGVLTLIPLIGLFVLVVINSKATTALNANGVRVGFFGASWADLDDLRREPPPKTAPPTP